MGLRKSIEYQPARVELPSTKIAEWSKCSQECAEEPER